MLVAKTVIAFAVLVYSCILHEIMHAWTADKMGDDTARRQGRITLNPFPHIDPWYSILMPAILWFSSRGVLCLGGAKPVPIVAEKFRNPARGFMLSAAAGPATNLVLAGLAALLLIACARWAPAMIHQAGEPTVNGVILGQGLMINVGLFMFNLVPIPPLDGSRVLGYFLSPTARDRMRMMEVSGLGWFLVMIFVVVSGELGIISAAGWAVLVMLQGPMGAPAWKSLYDGLTQWS